MMEFLFDLATQIFTCGITGWYFYRKGAVERLTGGLIEAHRQNR